MADSKQVENVGDVNASLDHYLPSDPDEYAALEKRLVRRIDWTLMPVLVAMIVLKYVNQAAPISNYQSGTFC